MQIDDKKAVELQSFVKEANVQLEKEAAEDAAVATSAPALADYLISVEAVPVEKRAALIADLSDPIKAHSFMKKLAASWQQYRKQAKEVVAPEGKTAEHRDAGGASEADSERAALKPSDRAYYAKLGFTV